MKLLLGLLHFLCALPTISNRYKEPRKSGRIWEKIWAVKHYAGSTGSRGRVLMEGTFNSIYLIEPCSSRYVPGFGGLEGRLFSF